MYVYVCVYVYICIYMLINRNMNGGDDAAANRASHFPVFVNEFLLPSFKTVQAIGVSTRGLTQGTAISRSLGADSTGK